MAATEILNVYINFEYDAESGLYHLRARPYNPETGRFLSAEPTGIDGPNLYWYARNNPVNNIDPNGLETYGVGASGTLTAFGSSFTLGFQFVADDKGNVGFSYFGGAGGGASNTVVSGGLAVDFTVTGANTICDLRGLGVQIGGSISIPTGPSSLGAEYVRGREFQGGTFSIGIPRLSFSQSHSFYVIPTGTNVHSFGNINNLFKDSLEDSR